MATNTLTIKMRMPSRSEYERLGAWFDSLPQRKRDQFQGEWNVLKSAGAELADAGFSYGIVHCWFSDDFRQHCRKFGFELQQE